jgi:hypothetical protein
LSCSPGKSALRDNKISLNLYNVNEDQERTSLEIGRRVEQGLMTPSNIEAYREIARKHMATTSDDNHYTATVSRGSVKSARVDAAAMQQLARSVSIKRKLPDTDDDREGTDGLPVSKKGKGLKTPEIAHTDSTQRGGDGCEVARRAGASPPASNRLSSDCYGAARFLPYQCHGGCPGVETHVSSIHD